MRSQRRQKDKLITGCWLFIASTGTFIGTRLSEKIPAHKLKKGFGWLVLAIKIDIMLLHELILT